MQVRGLGIPGGIAWASGDIPIRQMSAFLFDACEIRFLGTSLVEVLDRGARD